MLNITLSPHCVPEDLISRDGFSRSVPRQPAHFPYSVSLATVYKVVSLGWRDHYAAVFIAMQVLLQPTVGF